MGQQLLSKAQGEGCKGATGPKCTGHVRSKQGQQEGSLPQERRPSPLSEPLPLPPPSTSPHPYLVPALPHPQPRCTLAFSFVLCHGMWQVLDGPSWTLGHQTSRLGLALAGCVGVVGLMRVLGGQDDTPSCTASLSCMLSDHHQSLRGQAGREGQGGHGGCPVCCMWVLWPCM